MFAREGEARFIGNDNRTEKKEIYKVEQDQGQAAED